MFKAAKYYFSLLLSGEKTRPEKRDHDETAKKKRVETAEEKQKRITTNKLHALLSKQKDLLKKDVQKKRALLDKKLSTEIQVSGNFKNSLLHN